MEANSTVNLVPLGQSITELQMRENRDFVVPVNILTTFACAPFSWAARHTTVCLDTPFAYQFGVCNPYNYVCGAIHHAQVA